MKEFNVFDDYSNLIAIVAGEDRAKEIAEREDGYYRSVEKSNRKRDEKIKEKTKYILKDMGADRVYPVVLTIEQERFWDWLIDKGILCDVSLEVPVEDGFEKI